jgi:hypothetical protein
MELLAVIANADAGDDGMYRTRQPDAIIAATCARRGATDAARARHPARALDFFTETARLRKWLQEPDVGLALDPEWRGRAGRSRAGDRPGRRRARSTRRPPGSRSSSPLRPAEKLFIVHQFTTTWSTTRHSSRARAGRGAERRRVRRARDQEGEVPRVQPAAPTFDHGFKLFYHEDTDLMTPRSVLRLRPSPDVVVYE